MMVMVTNWNMHLTGGTERLAVWLVRAHRAMGHEAFIFSPCRGAFAAWNEDVPVLSVTEKHRLPKSDVSVVMHPGALENVGVKPSGKRVYLACGWAPPETPVDDGPYLALSDEVAAWLRFRGVESEVVPMGVPLDEFQPGPPLRADAPRVAHLAIRATYGDILREAVREAGMEWVSRGFGDAPKRDMVGLYHSADIVVGTEGCIIEGMACGRAALVRRAPPRPVPPGAPTVEAVVEALRGYSPDMGVVNRKLAAARHDVTTLAGKLLEAACG